MSSGSLEGRVAEHRLANGLTVLVLPRPSSPTVSLQMTFRVGGVDEPAGENDLTPLMWATAANRLEAVRTLVAAGCLGGIGHQRLAV